MNLRVVGGKPLLVWTVEQALSARPAMDVVVSSDDEVAVVYLAVGAGS
jgi:N-acylneuraminate cytidylyltransferase